MKKVIQGLLQIAGGVSLAYLMQWFLMTFGVRIPH